MEAENRAGQPPPSPDTQCTVDMVCAGSTVVLEVIGELDMLTTPKLDEQVKTALTSEPAVLVIDLTSVTFLGSLGAAALLLANSLATDNTDVRIVASAGEPAAEALRLMGLGRELSIYPSRNEALDDRAPDAR